MKKNTLSEIKKNTLDGINNRLGMAEEKIAESEYINGKYPRFSYVIKRYINSWHMV